MGMSIFDMFEDDTPVTLQVGKGVVNFRYNNGRLSPANMADLSMVEPTTDEIRLMAQEMMQLARLVAAVVTWWDVMDNDGQTVPLTVEAAATLPVKFLQMVLNKIKEVQEGEAQPGETMNPISDATLPRQEKSVAVQSGTRSLSPLSGVGARPGNSFPKANRSLSNGHKRH